MRTQFDDITDDEIELAVSLVREEDVYSELESDLRRIANLAWWMFRWKAWLGPPVTVFGENDFEFDGQHRTRAAKFIARRRSFQILIPMRFA